MTPPLTDDDIHAALPADGTPVAFYRLVERTGSSGQRVHAALTRLRDDGRAELLPGAGWKRAGVPVPPGREDAALDDYMESVEEIVGRAGHMVQWVASGDGTAPFAYTIGLLPRLGFELLVTGALPPEALQSMLNGAADLDSHPVGVLLPGIIPPPYSGMLVATDTLACREAGFPLAIAHRWWRGGDPWHPRDVQWEAFPVMQVVWPDKSYRWPWHDAFDYPTTGELGGQPVVGTPPPTP